MSTSRVHHSLPAPVIHAGFSISQSKSHVLAGVQDAYWSDDEAEDAECPLCLEEMDISDLNFKPCICGYQICRFCWHHIKENLNGRCPACRRVYTDEAVEFKPIAQEDHKRLTQQKKQRERERKELDALGRRQLANVRVVQRNVVYVVGIGPRFAKEELIPTLRSNEYFGQYGKITKLILVKRTPSGGGAPVVGLYITYHRREDAARSIAAVDGTASPGGGREIMRASYGTTKYCMAFLRGVSCGDHNCMNLHEWGDEKDCFTKEDLTTLKHTMKATESRTRTITTKKGEDGDGLPRAASWAQKGSSQPVLPGLHNNTNTSNHMPSTMSTRQARRGTGIRQPRNSPASSGSDPRPLSSRNHQDRKAGTTKTPSQASSSRPSTPAATLPSRPVTPPDVKALRQKKESHTYPPHSPAPSVAAESDLALGSQDPMPSSSPADSAQSADMIPSAPSLPPGIPTPPSSAPSNPFNIPAVPPGLSAPPGIPTPSRPPRVDTASPQTPLLASQSSYQMSNAARALLDDVKARRESVAPTTSFSPFPDFDRTLQTLSGGDGGFGGFSFNLDLKLAGDEASNSEPLPDFEVPATAPFHGPYVDAFPALRSPTLQNSTTFMAPPGLPYPHNPTRSIYDPLSGRTPPITPIDGQSTSGSNYTGSFNPFADGGEDSNGSSSSRRPTYSFDDDRKVSRFGFARGRQGSTATSSPLHVSSPLSNSDSNSFYNSAELPQTPAQPQWLGPGRLEYGYPQPSSAMGSPLPQHTQAQGIYPQQQSRFQPFDSGVSEAQLRDLIQSSRDRASSSAIRNNSTELPAAQYKFALGMQTFNDPAIMSAGYASPMMGSQIPEASYMSHTPENVSSNQLTYGPPPGLSYPQSSIHSTHSISADGNGSTHVSSSSSPSSSLVLSSSEFPALNAGPVEPGPSIRPEDMSLTDDPTPDANSKVLEKAERKAAKKAAAAEKAVERQRQAQEKATIRAAEKAKIAQERAAEKEKAALLKAQKEAEEKEKAAEIEKAKASQLEKERAAQAEKGKAAQAEKEKAAQAEKEKAAQEKKTVGRQADAQKLSKRPEAIIQKSSSRQTPTLKPPSTPATVSEPSLQVPLLSKKPKKNKPVAKPIRVVKDEDTILDDTSTIPSSPLEAHRLPATRAPNTATSSSNHSRAQSVDRNTPPQPPSLKTLFAQLDTMNPAMDIRNHPIFDTLKINSVAKMPLEYGPLVHALSALSVGGGSFANNMPSGSIDNAVSSFQQLLETLTQTISDLLRLLPRTTWDDSSSFDGVLRDMLKGDDFLDDGGEDAPGREDEVAALTLALERRARWMEVQLSKLEELHRDINTAAVRAILSFNDSGWDRHGFLPHMGNTLRRFDNIGVTESDTGYRSMTADELEKKLFVAREAAVFAETEYREVVEIMRLNKPTDVDEM